MQTSTVAPSSPATKLLLVLMTAGLATAQGPCGWNGLDGGVLSGGDVVDLAVYDTGSGPQLYASGIIGTGSDIGVLRWTGTEWASIGTGLGTVAHAMTVFDGGSGAAIHVATESGVRKWSGGTWSLLASPFGVLPVRVLTTLDDGSGPRLFASGDYGAVASFDGSQWTTFPSLPPSSPFSPAFVTALTWFDRGTGPELYVGGGFTLTGGNNLARWNGTSWVAVGNPGGTIDALTVHDDGSGPALWVGGSFQQIGGVAANRLAKWDGVTWSAPATISGGSNTIVNALASRDDGSGPALYIGGRFTSVNGVAATGVARWNGTSWSGMAGGFDGQARSFAVFDDGTGPHLFCGGNFTANTTTTSLGVAKWSSSAWLTTGPGLSYGCPGVVNAACSVCEVDGVALYAGGSFGVAGGDAARNIARWDGTSWSNLGLGVRGNGARVMSLHSFDDGNGPALFAGGRLDLAGSIATAGIARWDGSNWSDVGGGVGYPGSFPEVHAMTTFDGGLGPELIVGGYFTTAGGLPASNIARWNGNSWSPLGSGVNAIVTGLTVCDLGAGDVLVACGDFTVAGGATVSGLASWNGTTWAPLVSTGAPYVSAICTYDDGTGLSLYAAVGSPGSWSVVKRVGGSWTNLGSVSAPFLPSILALAVADTPTGPALWIGGHFTQIAGVAAQSIAWWNGTSWTGANPGVAGWNTSGCASIPEVEVLATYRQGGRDSLIAGGLIGSIDGVTCNGIGLHACVTNPASFSTFGVGCAGSLGMPALKNADCSLPWVGSQLDLVMDNLPPNPTVMCFGLSNTSWSGTPLPLSLTSIGMPGCTAYVSAEVLVPLTNQSGTARYSLQIPGATALSGLPIFVQGLVVDLAANPLGVVVSGAGAAILGN